MQPNICTIRQVLVVSIKTGVFAHHKLIYETYGSTKTCQIDKQIVSLSGYYELWNRIF